MGTHRDDVRGLITALMLAFVPPAMGCASAQGVGTAAPIEQASPVEKVPPARSGLMATAVGERVFVAGGIATDDRNDTRFHDLNVASGEWTPLPRLPHGRSLGGMVAVGEKLYLLGGVGVDGECARWIDVFNTASGAWEESIACEALPSRCAIALLNGEIFVVGGIEEGAEDEQGHHSARVRAFKVADGTWSEKASLMHGRHAHAAAAYNGRIWVSGGYLQNGQSTATVEVYDPGSGKWIDGPSMQRARVFHGMLTVKNDLVVWGDRSDLGVVERLRGGTLTWLSGGSMTEARHRGAGVAIGEDVYVIDGEDKDGRPRGGVIKVQMFPRSPARGRTN